MLLLFKMILLMLFVAIISICVSLVLFCAYTPHTSIQYGVCDLIFLFDEIRV